MNETVSIIGMACRLPGASSVDEYWKLLIGNRDAITEVPRDRFDISQTYDPTPATPDKTLSRFGGFIDGVQDFDAGFFRISPREARTMDPQQRLLLHVVWEALEDSGIPPSTLTGKRCGVFVGQATSEYAAIADTHSGSDLLGITGNGIRAVTAGRISNAFDLHGPSMVIDTACSSSLAAVHLGRQSLLAGESDLVIVAGANLVLTPADAISYSQGDLLAADGRCKFGDVSADGFVRSDGIAVVVLKRTGDAERDGDPIRAALLGSAVNNDGEGEGLLVKPTVPGQRELVRAACHTAGIQPDELDYVEAHGTGTVVGDTVELEALSTVLGDRRAAGNPLYVGSVKTNIGHTEAAAGIAGLIKATLIAEHGVIPASLHLREPNAVLARTGSLSTVDANRELRPLGDRALLGVSSFGISGTNAHVIITGERTKASAESAHGSDDGGPHVLVLSARSEPALLKLAESYADYLGPDGAGMPHDLRDICHAAAVDRDALSYRLWVVGTTRDELATALRELAAGKATPGGSVQHTADRGTPPRVVFVFPGQGGQWIGMGRRLLEVSPAFTAAMERCDEAVRAELGWSVMARLRDLEPADLHSVDVVQPVLWAVEVALAALVRSSGIDPDVCLGHSMGEIAAAHEAGALSLDQAAAVICRRSRLMKRRSGQGRMLATELATAEAEAIVAREPGVCVAVENSPHSTVLSGENGAIDRIAAMLDERGVHHRQINVDVASHSPQMDDVCSDLLHELGDLGEPAEPRAAELASAVHDRSLTAADLSSRYWADNLRRPVRFGRAIHRLAAKSSCVFVELSPHPVLINVLHEYVQGAARGGAVALQNRREPEDLALAKAVGRFFAAGGVVAWDRYHGRQAPRVPLPAYQWDVESFWLTDRPDSAHSVTTRQHGDGTTRTITLGELGALDSCRETSVHGKSRVPLSAYLDAALFAATDAGPPVNGSAHRGGPWTLCDVRLTGGMLEIGDADDIGLHLRVQGHESDFERPFTIEAGRRHQVTGRLHRSPAGTHSLLENGTQQLDAALARCDTYLTGTAFHRAASTRGYTFHHTRPVVLHAWRRDGTAVVQVRPASPGRTAAIEAAMQALIASWPSHGDAGNTTCAYAATAVREAVVAEIPDECLWSIAWFSTDGAIRPAQADVLVLTMSGEPVAAFNGISLSRLPIVTRAEDARPLPSGDRPTHLATIRPAHRQSEFIGHIAHVLGTSTDRIDLHKSLRDMGLDSLMAAQLRHRLATATGDTVTTAQLLEPTSAEHLIGRLHAGRTERAMA